MIGVIVVFYNAQKYAKVCLESIENQTFKDFKCICIDDKSTDKTFDILKTFVDKDSRFISIQNEKNYGSASHSRNVGLENIKDCDYFIFVDGDDILHFQALEVAYETILKTKADFVSYELHKFENESLAQPEKIDKANLKFEVYSEPFKLFLTKSKDYARANATNKLYSYEKYKKFRFCEDIFYEDDYMYTLQVLSISSLHARILEPPLYFYRKHDLSITSTLKSERYLQDAINRIKHTYDYFIKEDNISKDVDEIFKKRMMNDVYRMIISKTLRKTKDEDLFVKLVSIAQNAIKELLELKVIELRYLSFFRRFILKQFVYGNVKIASCLVKIFG
ncbi:MAG: glycosyltransferase family 2 protein [Campylobacteraceae bacterium]|jgi:glycosyltransferase involved in cell wall biosynthesis|nr:glycosyltransferase family 2 protein [Campylobacteraceae bacterium]